MKRKTANAIIAASTALDLGLRFIEDYTPVGLPDVSCHAVTGHYADFMQAVAFAAGTIAAGYDYDSHECKDDLTAYCSALATLRYDDFGRNHMTWF
jgi:hypothetical protein